MFITRRRRETKTTAQVLADQVAELFAAGEQGGWYDPSDFSTLFQDAGGTTPVTAPTQEVRLMRDKSSRGNHVTFSAGVTLQTSGGLFFLLPNGTTSTGATSAINASAFNKLMLCVGLRKLSDAAVQDVVSSNVAAGTNFFRFTHPSTAGQPQGIMISAGTTAAAATEATPIAAPMTAVYTCSADISAPSINIRRNGASNVTNTGNQGTGNYSAAAPLRLFSRDGTVNPYGGRFYGGIVRFSSVASTAQQIASAEAWVNSKTGAF